MLAETFKVTWDRVPWPTEAYGWNAHPVLALRVPPPPGLSSLLRHQGCGPQLRYLSLFPPRWNALTRDHHLFE